MATSAGRASRNTLAMRPQNAKASSAVSSSKSLGSFGRSRWRSRIQLSTSHRTADSHSGPAACTRIASTVPWGRRSRPKGDRAGT
jgi:hypothetical protein